MTKKIKPLCISVQSNKGGVGKTTAALNLSRLLLQKNYLVFLFDFDFTGTNINEGIKSSIWQDEVNRIKLISSIDDKKGKKEIDNILDLFTNYFLMGAAIPAWLDLNDQKQEVENRLLFNSKKINVFGSQLYSADKKREIICQPSILFDDLHSFWLLELIKMLITTAENYDSKIAVIFDNSPGYSGMQEHLIEWFTDMGPEIGKFLIVSSPDSQDMVTSLNLMGLLHKDYKLKFDTSLVFNDFVDNIDKVLEISSLGKKEKKFFFRLGETKDSNDTSLNYYFDELNDTLTQSKMESYIGWIINKVNLDIINKMFVIDLSDLPIDSVIKSTYFPSFKSIDKLNLIPYSNDYDIQFIKHFFKRNQSKYNNSLRWLDYNLEKIEKSVVIKSTDDSLRSINIFEDKLNVSSDSDYNLTSFEKLVKRIEFLQNAFLQIESHFDRFGLANIRSNFNPLWKPENFNYQLRDLFLDESPEFSSGREKLVSIDNDEVKNEIRRFFKSLREEIYSNSITNDNIKLKNTEFDFFAESFLFSVYFLIVENSNIVFNNEFQGVIFKCYEFPRIQYVSWLKNREKSKRNISVFLNQLKLNNDEYLRISNKNMYDNKRKLNVLFEYFSKSQARLFDINKDTIVMIGLFRRVCLDKLDFSDLSLTIRTVLDKTIIDKSINYRNVLSYFIESSIKKVTFEEFEKALNKIIKEWGI